jgi:HPt (histidine-containing phosphotransfer) domain-containing protein
MIGAEALSEVLNLYLENAPGRLEAVRDALLASDTDAAARALHDLKSGAEMVGAFDVHRLALELERQARDGDLEAVRAGVDRLESALSRAEVSLGCARERLGL